MYGQNKSPIALEELKTLLSLSSAGNGRAFFLLVDLYWNNVYSQAVTYIHSPQLAEELTQDVFMKIWNYRARLPALESFEKFFVNHRPQCYYLCHVEETGACFGQVAGVRRRAIRTVGLASGGK